MTSPPEAFFHRRTTHRWIYELAAPTDVTIYAGLGATIDRTGLDWNALLDALLSKYLPDRDTRKAIEERYNPIQLATVLDGYYSEKIDSAPEDPERERLDLVREDIRDVLYGPRKNMNGKLAQSLTELAFQTALSGKSVILVTPNYDEYLYHDLVTYGLAYREVHPQLDSFPQVRLYVVDDEATPKPDEWSDPGDIHVVYIHGYIAKERGKHRGTPVLSEGDYGDRSGRTRATLAEIFQDRTIIVVGSSLADAPLVNALADTKPKEDEEHPNRVAILSSSSAVADRSANGDALSIWHDRRLRYMGLTPIYADYHIQVGQFLYEIQQCMSRGYREEMTKAHSPHRYGFRLSAWWRDWYEQNIANGSLQQQHHQKLVSALADIRSQSGIPLDDNLKLEFWLRWRPESSRKLALWASSTGTWIDTYMMRRDEIRVGSDYRAVQIFCGGAPRFLSEAPESESRWRRYLGLPIWNTVDAGRVPVAVISLASMDESGFLREENLGVLRHAIGRMQDVGTELVHTDLSSV